MALTRCAAAEAAPSGVRVNAVSPSLAEHPFLNRAIPDEDLAVLRRRELFGRGAETWEVANVIVFLASDYSSYLSRRGHLREQPAPMTGIGGAPAGQEDPRADLIWGTVPRLVEDAATRHGAIEAIVDGDVRLTFVAAGVGGRPLRPRASWPPASVPETGWRSGPPTAPNGCWRALGALRAGAVLVPLEHALQRWRGRLHPAHLGRHDVGDRSGVPRCRLSRHAGGGGHGRARAHRAAQRRGWRATPPRVPLLGLREFLGGRRGGGPRRDGGPGGCGRARRHLGPHLHLGHDRLPQGSGDDPGPDAAHLRHLVLHRWPGSGRSLSGRQPLLPYLRLQGGHPGLPHGRRDGCSRAGLRRGRGHGAHRGRAHQCAPGTTDALPDAAGRSPAGRPRPLVTPPRGHRRGRRAGRAGARHARTSSASTPSSPHTG